MSEPIANSMEIMPAASQQYVQQAEARSLNFLNPKLWQAMGHAAQVFIQSGALPQGIKNAPQAIMVMQAGYEMGLQPVEALQSFCFINGKLSLFGEVAIALPVRQGHSVTWGKCDATTATVTIKNKNTGSEMTNTFTMAMAEARGLAGKEPYKKWPENMLKFKAFHMTAKFVCPEAFHGVPMREELQEIEVMKAEKQLPDDEQVIHVEAPTARKTTSLEEALEKPEPPKPEKPLKASKTKAKPQEEPSTPIVPPAPESQATKDIGDGNGSIAETVKTPEPTDEEKFHILVEKELRGEKLTAIEQMFMGKHTAIKTGEPTT